LEFIILFSIAYILYITFLYPIFIPGYGFGETFSLNSDNEYTVSITVSAPRTALNIRLTGNTSFDVNIHGVHHKALGSFEYKIPAYRSINITLSSGSPAVIKLSGRSEIPYMELVFFGFLLILSTIMFIKTYGEWKRMLSSK
jgi:hypothetical protein